MDQDSPVKPAPAKQDLVIRNVLQFGYMHLAALYGIYLCFTSAKWSTIIWTWVLIEISLLGITAGVHRLWTHRSYKVKWPLEVILLVFNSIAFLNTAYDWVRDHRVHHKYSDTDADPHNSNRGLFYSQIGWLMLRKHPEVIKKGKTIYMDDIYQNKLLMFQKKYAFFVIGFWSYVFPIAVPMYFWNESFSNSYHLAVMLRHVLVLHITFLVNSVAHFYGMRPYDKNIRPTENLVVSLLTTGEGFHNYHHAFPYDYKTSEFGNNKYNLATLFINFFAWIGWAYDLKSVPDKLILARQQRTGETQHLWGWGDTDQAEQESKEVERLKCES